MHFKLQFLRTSYVTWWVAYCFSLPKWFESLFQKSFWIIVFYIVRSTTKVLSKLIKSLSSRIYFIYWTCIIYLANISVGGALEKLIPVLLNICKYKCMCPCNSLLRLICNWNQYGYNEEHHQYSFFFFFSYYAMLWFE